MSTSEGSDSKADALEGRCRVLGCDKDMAQERRYYQRHMICEEHLKSLCLVVDGQRMRFCQQCARLHSIFEFDGSLRSCRARLKHRNKRRLLAKQRRREQENQRQLQGEHDDATGAASRCANTGEAAGRELPPASTPGAEAAFASSSGRGRGSRVPYSHSHHRGRRRVPVENAFASVAAAAKAGVKVIAALAAGEELLSGDDDDDDEGRASARHRRRGRVSRRVFLQVPSPSARAAAAAAKSWGTQEEAGRVRGGTSTTYNSYGAVGAGSGRDIAGGVCGNSTLRHLQLEAGGKMEVVVADSSAHLYRMLQQIGGARLQQQPPSECETASPLQTHDETASPWVFQSVVTQSLQPPLLAKEPAATVMSHRSPELQLLRPLTLDTMEEPGSRPRSMFVLDLGCLTSDVTAMANFTTIDGDGGRTNDELRIRALELSVASAVPPSTDGMLSMIKAELEREGSGAFWWARSGGSSIDTQGVAVGALQRAQPPPQPPSPSRPQLLLRRRLPLAQPPQPPPPQHHDQGDMKHVSKYVDATWWEAAVVLREPQAQPHHNGYPHSQQCAYEEEPQQRQELEPRRWVGLRPTQDERVHDPLVALTTQQQQPPQQQMQMLFQRRTRLEPLLLRMQPQQPHREQVPHNQACMDPVAAQRQQAGLDGTSELHVGQTPHRLGRRTGQHPASPLSEGAMQVVHRDLQQQYQDQYQQQYQEQRRQLQLQHWLQQQLLMRQRSQQLLMRQRSQQLKWSEGDPMDAGDGACGGDVGRSGELGDVWRVACASQRPPSPQQHISQQQQLGGRDDPGVALQIQQVLTDPLVEFERRHV